RGKIRSRLGGFGAWMPGPPAVSSCPGSQLSTASTKRSVPAASKGGAWTISPSSLAIGRPHCALWSAGFVPKCKLAKSPPFWATAPGAPPAAASSSRSSHPRDDSRRRCARVEPGSGTAPAHARRRGVSLPALVGPCTLRAPDQRRQLSWLRDGARDQCVVELARPEAPRQRTAQPHQRLELRRGRGLVCRPQCAPQEILRDRLLLSYHTRPPAKVTLRLDQRRGACVVSASQHLLSGLSPDPVSGRCHRAGPALPAQAWQSRAQCAELLRARAREPGRLLCQRESHPA